MKRNAIVTCITIWVWMLLFNTYSVFPQDKKDSQIKVATSAICGQCKDKIEKGLVNEKGIKDVSLDLNTKIVTVTYNPAKTNPAEIRSEISKMGYDADTVKADKGAYEKLPACCKKDASKR